MRPIKITLLIMSILLTAITAVADKKKATSVEDQSLYIVSAKSGIVSIIDGDVTFKRGTSVWESLLEGDELKAGDVIKTGATGRAEILLNPGTYLRIAEDSEFAFPDLASFKLKLSLLKGTAILETSVVDVSIKFTTPQYMFTITRDGLYRFSATPEGKSEVMIRKGRLTVAGAEIKDGKKVVIENGPPAILAFDKKAEDDFDTWSKTRARTIIASNKKLSNSRMKSSVMAGFYRNAWIYDPFSRSYTFLPGGIGLSSPYGFNYSNCNPFWYRNPYGYSNNGNSGWGNGNSGFGNSTGNNGASNSSAGSYSKGTSTVSSPPPAPPSTGSSLGGRDRMIEKRRDN
jgi:hypothetical protein